MDHDKLLEDLKKILSSLEHTGCLEEFKDSPDIVKRRIKNVTEALAEIAYKLLRGVDVPITPQDYIWNCPLCGHRQTASTYKSQCKACKQLFEFVPEHREEFVSPGGAKEN